MKYRALLPQLLLTCCVFVPQLSRAQTCEWDRFPEPSADPAVIEVLNYGGYGPPAGRTLVSVDASGRIVLLARGQCPDRALVGRLATPSFDDLADELERAVEAEVIRAGRIESRCQAPEDGVDLDVTFYRDGSKEHYKCVTGALLRFGERVLGLVGDAICANRATTVCIERTVPP